MKEKIVLLGAGPLGVNAAHIIQQQGIFEIAGFVDSKGGAVAGYNVLGDDSVLDTLQRSGISNALVCIGNPNKRITISAEIKCRGFNIPALVHPSADLGIGAKIGEGSILLHGVFVGPEAIIGPYCVLEAGAFVGHNTILYEGVLLSARTVVGNFTSIGRCTTFKLGAGCTNKLRIGHNCSVGDFRTLLMHLDDNSRVEGASPLETTGLYLGTK
jgi:UDP-3-O-[3-hydroxymyristoyl] glucosamine N-acyltransferase